MSEQGMIKVDLNQTCNFRKLSRLACVEVGLVSDRRLVAMDLHLCAFSLRGGRVDLCRRSWPCR